MRPSVAVGLIVVVVLVVAFLVFAYAIHRSENSNRNVVRRKEWKAAQQEAAILRKAFRQVEDLAWAQLDGLVLSKDLMSIVRSTRSKLEGEDPS